jgi:hypothetical protein
MGVKNRPRSVADAGASFMYKETLSLIASVLEPSTRRE